MDEMCTYAWNIHREGQEAVHRNRDMMHLVQQEG